MGRLRDRLDVLSNLTDVEWTELMLESCGVDTDVGNKTSGEGTVSAKRMNKSPCGRQCLILLFIDGAFGSHYHSDYSNRRHHETTAAASSRLQCISLPLSYASSHRHRRTTSDSALERHAGLSMISMHRAEQASGVLWRAFGIGAMFLLCNSVTSVFFCTAKAKAFYLLGCGITRVSAFFGRGGKDWWV